MMKRAFPWQVLSVMTTAPPAPDMVRWLADHAAQSKYVAGSITILSPSSAICAAALGAFRSRSGPTSRRAADEGAANSQISDTIARLGTNRRKQIIGVFHQAPGISVCTR